MKELEILYRTVLFSFFNDNSIKSYEAAEQCYRVVIINLTLHFVKRNTTSRRRILNIRRLIFNKGNPNFTRVFLPQMETLEDAAFAIK
jgi:hypothetical protein